MKAPTLSIIIPTFNAARAVTDMLDSIVAQDYGDYEVITVDDKSTDKTREVIEKFIEAHPDKAIRLVKQDQNQGAASARNRGINEAHGKYLMFLDADDKLKPDALSTFITAASKPKTNLVVSGFTIETTSQNEVASSVDVCVDRPSEQNSGEPWRLYIIRLLGLDGRLYQVWNKVYLANNIKKNNVNFPTGIDFGEDLLFNLRYLSTINCGIRWITAPLYLYRQNLDGGTFSKTSLIYTNRQQNYAAVVDFAKDLPAGEPKDSLLNWLKYDWIYSHLLAVTSAKKSKQWKINNVKKVAEADGKASYSNPKIIGQKRYRLEKILHYCINRPRFGLWLIGFTMRLKNNATTAKIWRRLRERINH